jgi:hypothetical protein
MKLSRASFPVVCVLLRPLSLIIIIIIIIIISTSSTSSSSSSSSSDDNSSTMSLCPPFPDLVALLVLTQNLKRFF